MTSAALLLLGEDGVGYDLARRLDGAGAWRRWLGDGAYAAFAPALTSPAAWDSFMSSDQSSPSNLRLQLRARALLFDKVSAAVCLPPPPPTTGSKPTSNAAPKLNPSYLQLHGDDIYYTLEVDSYDGDHQKQSQPAFSTSKGLEQSTDRSKVAGSRYNDSENESTSQRHKHDELHETWYSMHAEKYRMRRNQSSQHGEKELHKRTPEGMCTYLRLREIHKRKRQVFQEDMFIGSGQTTWANGLSGHQNAMDVRNSIDEDIYLSPETMFPSNCVPDTALPPRIGLEEKKRIEVTGALDNLPDVTSPSPAMMERFGLRPQYVRMGTKYRGRDELGGNRTLLGEERAIKMTNQAVARFLMAAGFEGGSEVAVEVFSDILGSHICKLGRTLRILTDSYRKQYSSIELLKMFLQATGHGNLGSLVEVIKDGNKGLTNQIQQNVRTLQPQSQNSLLQAKQFQRQMHPQMSMLQGQNLTFQQQQHQHQQQQQQQQQHQPQQWNKLQQRRQSTAPQGSIMMVDKDQPLVDVKTENLADTPIDVTYNSLNNKQMHLRQHQIAVANQLAQAGQHFKPLPSVQMPQLQAQSTYNNMRTPVKVEGLHELMSGDTTLKPDSEHNKMNSQQK